MKPRPPKPPRAWNSTLPRPSKPVPRNTKPIARSALPNRSGPPRKKNPERRESEFRRCYHSKAFVRFTKARPCYACGRTPCDVAHGSTGGMGRKSDWTDAFPLCSGISGCHAAQHRHGWMHVGMTEESRRRAAALHVEAWTEYTNRGSDDGETD